MDIIYAIGFRGYIYCLSVGFQHGTSSVCMMLDSVCWLRMVYTCISRGYMLVQKKP